MRCSRSLFYDSVSRFYPQLCKSHIDLHLLVSPVHSWIHQCTACSSEILTEHGGDTAHHHEIEPGGVTV